jgi:hypothetical protein
MGLIQVVETSRMKSSTKPHLDDGTSQARANSRTMPGSMKQHADTQPDAVA